MITNRRSQEKFNSKNGVNRPPLYDLSVYCGGLSWRKFMAKGQNFYQEKDDYSILIIRSKIFGDKEFLIDKEDAEKCKLYLWRIVKESKSDKLSAYSSKAGYLSRFLFDNKEAKRLYFKNGNYLDNRKNNISDIPNVNSGIKEGDVFGRLTVIKLDHIERKQTKRDVITKEMWECKCKCGKIITVSHNNLLYGQVKSCGCLHYDKVKNETYLCTTTHGKSKTRLYNIWCNMKRRCTNKKNVDYHNYGGRGIKVCDEWKNDFMSFYNWAINNGYSNDLTIDRIDVNGNYEPNNCKWATKQEQCDNKRNTVYLTCNNKTKTLSEWSKSLSIPKMTIMNRLKLGWDINKTLSTPAKQNKYFKCIETGKVYNNAAKAGRETKNDPSSILKCLKGKLNTVHGYHWEYITGES